jgi:hypothetical protein
MIPALKRAIKEFKTQSRKGQLKINERSKKKKAAAAKQGTDKKRAPKAR